MVDEVVNWLLYPFTVLLKPANELTFADGMIVACLFLVVIVLVGETWAWMRRNS